MNLKIRRRRFGQLAIASAATAVMTNFAAKTVAQQPNEVIYGVRPLTSSSTPKVPNPANPARRAPRVPNPATPGTSNPPAVDVVNNTPGIALITSELGSGKELSIMETPSVPKPGSPTNTNEERVSGFTALADGSFIVASVGTTTEGDVTRLIITDTKSPSEQTTELRVSGLPNENSTVESLVATVDGKLLSVISLNQGIQPFDLVNIDPKTGEVTNGDNLALPEIEPDRFLSNLAQSPDGKIYATSLGRGGGTSLVQLDLENRSLITGKGKIIRLVELKFENEPLESDLLSLAFSLSGELFALANPKYEKTNSLFSVDIKTGDMKLERKFDAAKIAFAPS